MEITRILIFLDEVRSESGRRTEPPLRKCAVAAIVKNPFAGRYVEDLSPLRQRRHRPRDLRHGGCVARTVQAGKPR
jgi:hypothetical protein